jgi:hypothetical protein
VEGIDEKTLSDVVSLFLVTSSSHKKAESVSIMSDHQMILLEDGWCELRKVRFVKGLVISLHNHAYFFVPYHWT